MRNLKAAEVAISDWCPILTREPHAMPKETLPITPAIVRWARERAGFSLEELAADFNKIAEWERGEGGPTYPQLETLAGKLKVPVAVFFFPTPPQTPPVEETFRTLPDAALASLPSRMKMLLRKAKAMQLNLVELHSGRNPSERLITREVHITSATPIASMAEHVRAYLGVALHEQQRWANPETALKNWREALQSVGIYVFKDAFKAPNFSGFCLTDPQFPIIYVNNSCAKTRQIFTLFHELAHLLFATSGIDAIEEIDARPGVGSRIEVICNQFAAEFLMPQAEFVRARANAPATEETAEQLAALFNVSRELVFRRFLDRGEISAATYRDASERWANQRQEGSGGDYYRTQLAYLGRDYISLAFSAFYQNRIDESQLASYLDICLLYTSDAADE